MQNDQIVVEFTCLIIQALGLGYELRFPGLDQDIVMVGGDINFEDTGQPRLTIVTYRAIYLGIERLAPDQRATLRADLTAYIQEKKADEFLNEDAS